ncbi:beta-lactamase/transpeptidase-like protein [Penicillium argentinense]|uniref:Beta-lactamase/transpeptidase-like protein n=1 Tax=Penicillium argentinense TaxID=1131581 RepID=A0A9W9FD02_9EURO|nr:beta-lactamase/transpeptidase-like protein [Penicillium argentinense]KAJ5097970.1 beta-lactamase/transpeptidase-like protein [Penicillium argentinense]
MSRRFSLYHSTTVMMMLSIFKLLFPFCAFLAELSHVNAACEPEISYPAPIYGGDVLKKTFASISYNLDSSIHTGKFNGTSFSLEISSSNNTLYSKHHTEKSLGGSTVNGSSVYRIASNTKLFTSLGVLQQEALGKLNLDDEATKYISELSRGHSKISWKGITIRSLLAHLSGLPDNYGDEDLLLSMPDPSVVGLPPVTEFLANHLPKCGAYSNWTKRCTTTELNRNLRQVNSVFASQQESSYSNVGFELLGEILANVTGVSYEEYISSSILKPLCMNYTSFTAPDESVAAKAGPGSYWGLDEGAGNSAGGLYSTSSDMITFLRWVINNYKQISPTLNWFQPSAWNSGSHSLLGYPWEIFRSTEILPNTKRPVTFYTKGGGLTGYYTYSIIIPQYDLAVFVAAAGGLSSLHNIFTDVINPLVIGAEDRAQSQLEALYAGTYCSTQKGLNSTITFSHSDSKSLHIKSWISNSTDVLGALKPLVSAKAGTTGDMYFQLMPTFRNKTSSDGRVGEIWRFINVIDDYVYPTNATTIWNDYCVANVDPMSYGAVPLNEAVFWRASNDSTSTVEEVTLSAFRVTLRRE